ncbi:MAG: PGPGW domain-containing protein [Arenicellales bacterium]
MKSYFDSKLDSVKKGPKAARISIGLLLVVGGLFGFLPVLGFWMIPLGLVILAVDFRWARHTLVNARWKLRTWRRRYLSRRNNRMPVPSKRSK